MKKVFFFLVNFTVILEVKSFASDHYKALKQLTINSALHNRRTHRTPNAFITPPSLPEKQLYQKRKSAKHQHPALRFKDIIPIITEGCEEAALSSGKIQMTQADKDRLNDFFDPTPPYEEGSESDSSSQDTAPFDRDYDDDDIIVFDLGDKKSQKQVPNRTDRPAVEEGAAAATNSNDDSDEDFEHGHDSDSSSTVTSEEEEEEEDGDQPAIKTIKTPPYPGPPPVDYEALAQQYIKATREGNDIDAERLLNGENFNMIFKAIPNKAEQLFEAVQYGNRMFLKKAITAIVTDREIDSSLLEARNKDDKTLLQLALETDKPDIAEDLVKEAKEFKSVSDYRKKAFQALRSDRDDIIFYLIQYPYRHDPEAMTAATDIDGNSLIHIAAKNGSNKCLQLLIDNYYREKRTRLNMKNTNGDTPLHLAARKDHLDCVKILLESKLVDTITNNNDGLSPWRELKAREKSQYLKLKEKNKRKGVELGDAELKDKAKPERGTEAYEVRQLLKLARKYDGDKEALKAKLAAIDRGELNLSTTTTTIVDDEDDEDDEDDMSYESNYLLDEEEEAGLEKIRAERASGTTKLPLRSLSSRLRSFEGSK